MKRFLQSLGIFLFLCAAVIITAIGTHGEAPVWVQYSEPLAGENSPNFSDTINRPAKTIWNNFLIEHDENGYHDYSALAGNMNIDLSSKLDVSVFQLEHNGDGTHNFDLSNFYVDHEVDGTHALTTDTIAEGTNLYYTETRVTNNSNVSANTTHRTTIVGNPHNLDAADVGAVTTGTFTVEHNADGTHSFSIPSPSEYALSGTGTGNLASAAFAPTGLFTSGAFSVWGVVSFDRLNVAESLFDSVSTEYSETVIRCFKNAANQLSLALGTNIYTSTFTVTQTNKPTEIGCSFSGTQVFFWLDGQTDAAQAATAVFPTVNMQERLTIGEGLQGDVLYVSVSGVSIRSASAWFTPYSEGLSQCPECLLHFDMDEQTGGTLTDRLGTYTLSVSGTWQEYAAGY